MTVQCERTWKSDMPARSDDAYRQHRCGLTTGGDRHNCLCRYCGSRRS